MSLEEEILSSRKSADKQHRLLTDHDLESIDFELGDSVRITEYGESWDAKVIKGTNLGLIKTDDGYDVIPIR